MAQTPYIAVLLLLSSALQAASGWQNCRSISNDSERLACYDRYALALDKETAPPTTEEQKAAFGLPQKSPAENLHDISSRISKVETASRGKRILILENGQTWRQVGSSSQPRLAAGDTIVIEKGALGSFVLKKQGSNRSLRVKRIR
ncbi:hypothetical protein [Thiolapillus sp.]|uniref:hypothetical protein n=1 Tax=Thiolapillus sp. TaxID=2017437 RepID=UPI0025F5C922|nr:hypothetical protein [Thiolapillus sp.]